MSLAEVRDEPVVVREPHIGRCRHNQTGDGAALETPHPVRQHRAGNPAELLETHRQRRHGRLGPEVVGEVHEPPPAPRQHGAEHEQRPNLTPVHHQHVSRLPHRRAPPPMMPFTPRHLLQGDETPEVPRGARVTRRHRDRQQPLRGDPTLSLRDPSHDELADRVVVVHHHTDLARAGVGRVHDALHGLVCRATNLCGTPVRAHLAVDGIYVHTFPH